MDLFVPDIVRQSQFLSERASPSRFSGEYRLAVAILEDAIQIYCMEGSGRRNLQLRREAGRWLNSALSLLKDQKGGRSQLSRCPRG